MMLNMLGQLLKEAAWLIRYVTFDGHCAHAWMRECLFGTYETLKPCEVADVPFFGLLKHRPLPAHALPHFPVQLTTYDGSPVAAIPGVCFLTIFFSQLWMLSVMSNYM